MSLNYIRRYRCNQAGQEVVEREVGVVAGDFGSSDTEAKQHRDNV